MNHEKMTKPELIKALKKLQAASTAGQQPDELHQALHELQVHQIELEMQNRALRESQQELEASRDRYADLYDFAPLGYTSLDEETRISEINLAGAAMLGIERSRLKGKHFTTFVARDDAAGFLNYLKACRHSDHKSIAEIGLVPFKNNKVTVPVQLQCLAIQPTDSEGVLYRMAIIDMTEHKRVEAALRDSEERYRRLMEISPDAIFIVRENRIVFANNAGVKLFGAATEQDILEKSPLDFTHPAYNHLSQDFLRQAKNGGEPAPLLEKKIVRIDGTVRDVEVAAVALADHGVQALQVVMRDVTERKRMEHDLRHREQEIRSITENVPDVIARFDRQLRHLYINKQIEMYTGMPAETHIGKTKRELGMPEEVIELWDKKILEVFATGQALTFEFTFPTPQGTGYFECRLVPEADSAGSVETVLSVVRDTTERKQAEEALAIRIRQQAAIAALSQHALSSDDVLALMNEAVAVVATTLGVEYCKALEIQPGANALLLRAGVGWKEGLVGCATVDAGLDSQAGYTLISNGPVIVDDLRTESRFTGPPLLREHGVVSGMSVLIGGRERPFGVLGAHTKQRRAFTEVDIQFLQSAANVLAAAFERLQAEQANRESVAWFKEIFDGSRDAIFLVEADTKFMAVNNAACELTGYTQEELLSMAIPDLHNEEDLQAYRNHFDTIMSGEGVTTLASIRRKDGTKIPVEFSNHRITFRGRSIMHTTARDITERKRAEEERLRLEAQMRHAQKLESLGVLAGGIAHDFNNLLVGIMGNAGLAMMELPPESPARRSIQELEVAAQRAAELTNQMLAYSGKGKFVIETLILSTLIKEIAHLVESAISKKVQLVYYFDAGLPGIEGDATQLRQVVMNLITNAAEAMGNKEGVITVRTKVAQVDDKFLSEFYLADDLSAGRYVCFEVADSGSGMDAVTKAKIYDPFFTTKFTGRGLGLAAVLGIVRGHHGAIKVDSEVGRGTTFSVLLPCVAVEESAPAELVERSKDGKKFSGSIQTTANAVEPLAITDSTEAGLILVVDDEPSVRGVAERILHTAGFTVLTAADGREAADIFRRHSGEVALVLLDLTMPHMDGEETLRVLREIRSDTRVILSSGYTEQEAVNRFTDLGLAGFIQKPYQPQSLVGMIRGILKKE